MKEFVEETLEFTHDAYDVMLSPDLYRMFVGWCKVDERRTLTVNCFSRELNRVMPWGRVQVKVGGVPVRGFRYVKRKSLEG